MTEMAIKFRNLLELPKGLETARKGWKLLKWLELIDIAGMA